MYDPRHRQLLPPSTKTYIVHDQTCDGAALGLARSAAYSCLSARSIATRLSRESVRHSCAWPCNKPLGPCCDQDLQEPQISCVWAFPVSEPDPWNFEISTAWLSRHGAKQPRRRPRTSHEPPQEAASSIKEAPLLSYWTTGLLRYRDAAQSDILLRNATQHPHPMSESGFSSPYKHSLQLRLPQGALTMGFAGSSCVNSRQRKCDASEVFLKQCGRSSVQQIAHLLYR